MKCDTLVKINYFHTFLVISCVDYFQSINYAYFENKNILKKKIS